MTKISLTLYIISHSAISRRAIRNIESICSSTNFANLCNLEIIDLNENPGLAEEKKILATPLLIKNFPEPKIRIIGDLSNTEKVVSALALDITQDDQDE